MITRTFHPTKTYALKPWRKTKLDVVNSLVRAGWTYARIADYLQCSITTVQRYHIGFADNCLPRADGGFYHWSRDPRSVMYEGAACAI